VSADDAEAPVRPTERGRGLPSTEKAQLDAELALARSAVQLGKDSQNLPRFQITLGLAEFRSGHFAEADDALIAATTGERNLLLVGGPSAYFRAMILFRQGKPDEARKLATEAARMTGCCPGTRRTRVA
jgi:hypothetical protein